VGLTTPHRKKKLITKTSKEPRTWIFWINDPSYGIRILERWDRVMWAGLVWLRIGTGEELL
jgi:hypothetical protein